MSDFASNPVYVAPLPPGAEAFEDEPNKVTMTEAQRANGFVPGQPVAAEHLNYELGRQTANVEAAALCNLTAQVSGVATHLNGICWDAQNAQFVVVGVSGVIRTSEFGREWAAQTSGIATDLNDVAANSSIIVAVGSSGVIRTSPDGITWTGRTSGVVTYLAGVTWFAAASLFIAVGEDGVILTSPDGITWTPRASGTPVDLGSVTSNGSLAVAVGGDGFTAPITRSSDGITWINQDLGNVLQGVTWSEYVGLFCCVNSNAGAVTSPDGITWTPQVTVDPIFGRWTNTCLATDRHLLMAGTGGVLLSRDGATWDFADGLALQQLVSGAWNGRVAVFVGVDGIILNSHRLPPAQ